jgi:hypothetical protein
VLHSIGASFEFAYKTSLIVKFYGWIESATTWRIKSNHYQLLDVNTIPDDVKRLDSGQSEGCS